MYASAPPTITASHNPFAISWRAEANTLALDEHAVETTHTGPVTAHFSLRRSAGYAISIRSGLAVNSSIVELLVPITAPILQRESPRRKSSMAPLSCAMAASMRAAIRVGARLNSSSASGANPNTVLSPPEREPSSFIPDVSPAKSRARVSSTPTPSADTIPKCVNR